jgi:hypothetical protein
MSTARHFEKTAQVVSRIHDDHERYNQVRLWLHVFTRDNRAFKPDLFERRVEQLHLNPGSFSIFDDEVPGG